MAWTLFEFVDGKGRKVISEWIASQDAGHRGRIKSKLHTLAHSGAEVPPHLLTATKEKHIREIRINTNVAFRIFVCLGPLGMNEYTMLFRGTERDSVYVPSDSLQRAEANRLELLSDIHARRSKYD